MTQASEKVAVLGVNIDVVTIAQAVQMIVDHPSTEPPIYVVKPYVEFLDAAAGNTELTALLNNAELTIADGVALVWAAAWLYAGPRTLSRFVKTLLQIILAPSELLWPLPERAAGINFTWPLLVSAARGNRKIMLVGTPQTQTISQVKELLEAKIPGLYVVAAVPGDDTAEGHAGILEAIRTHQPDIVLVGMGWPRQEKLMAELIKKIDHGVLIGEGGTFDFEAFGGTRLKAPEWMQRIGIEWLWRLVLEPKRWRRQLAIPRFIIKVWQSR